MFSFLSFSYAWTVAGNLVASVSLRYLMHVTFGLKNEKHFSMTLFPASSNWLTTCSIQFKSMDMFLFSFPSLQSISSVAEADGSYVVVYKLVYWKLMTLKSLTVWFLKKSWHKWLILSHAVNLDWIIDILVVHIGKCIVQDRYGLGPNVIYELIPCWTTGPWSMYPLIKTMISIWPVSMNEGLNPCVYL